MDSPRIYRDRAQGAAVGFAHQNLYRAYGALRKTPAIALGVADYVWSIGELGDAGTDLNSLEVIVARLRRKIGKYMIQTERGRGYRLAGDESFIFPWRKVIIGF